MERASRYLWNAFLLVPILLVSLACIGVGLLTMLIPGKDSYADRARNIGFTVRRHRSWRSYALRGWLDDN